MNPESRLDDWWDKLTERERRWLQSADASAGGGLYAGCPWDAAPKVFAALERRGLVVLFEPANPSHKSRAVITTSGREALNDQGGSA